MAITAVPGACAPVKDAGGSMIANGQPGTRTLREYCRAGKSGTVAGGPAGANLHFREDSPQFGAVHTHLFTPISLNRYGGQRQDLDPKYNKTFAPKLRETGAEVTPRCPAPFASRSPLRSSSQRRCSAPTNR